MFQIELTTDVAGPAHVAGSFYLSLPHAHCSEDKKVTTFSLVAVVVACLVMGCDSQPGIQFVGEATNETLVQLTDSQAECDTPWRVCYLTSGIGGTIRGCWIREGNFVRARFPGLEDQRIPAREFRRTELAEDQNAFLDPQSTRK